MSRQEQVENILPTPPIEVSSQDALDSPYFAKGDWPSENWWEIFGSEELNSLIVNVLKQNPTLQQAQARIEQAKQNAIIVGAKLYPLVYFNASDNWEYLSKNGLYRALNPDIGLANSQIDFGLSFSYEFDFWGKYRNLYRAALGKEQAAIAELAQAELITTTSLAQSFFALKTNLVRKELLENLYQVRKNYFDLQTLLLKNSLLSKLPPLLSEERVFEAEQKIYKIDEEIALEKHLVNILAGLGPDEFLELSPDLPFLPEELALPSSISSELLVRRPDLMAEVWRIDAIAKEVGAAKAEYWPNINIAVTPGFQSGSWSDIFSWASKTIGVLPGLSLPIYTAGAIGANVGVKKALFDEAVYRYNDLILKSFAEVADMLAVGKSVYAQKEKQTEIVQNATERYELTLLREQKGLDSAFQVYSYLEELIAKQLDDVQLLYSQYLVAVKLTKALGGGYVSCKETP